MIFKSQVLTQASGSVGGVTYSHNAGGMYQRARTIPTNPQSGFQTQVRNAMTELVNAWTEILTPAQRAGWDLYASNVPTTNALGDPINLSGQNWYIGVNTPLLQAVSKFTSALARIDSASGIFDRGDFTDPVPAWTETSGLSMTFDNTDAWANEDNAAMFVFQGRPQNASRNFFKGPFRIVGAIEGDAVTAPTSPFTVTAFILGLSGFPVLENEAIWTGISVIRADGRISSRRIYGPDLAGA